MLKIFVSIAVFVVLAFFYIRYIELRSIFIPMREVITTPALIDLKFEDIFFNTEDGVKLNGWLIKSPGAKITFIFSHGNGGNISHRLEKIAMFYQLGVNTFIFDYRGYGKSSGRPSEEGVYRDVRAVYDYLISREDINQDRIVAYGESLGGAVAIDLATNRNVASLIVDSTFTSTKEMGRIIYPFLPSFIFRSKFDSKSKVKKLNIPKLFIHSENDEIVPFVLGEKLYNAAAEPKELFRIIGGHNSGFIECRNVVLETLKVYLTGLNLL